MDQSIDKIYSDMKAEFNITKFELEQITDSQFRVLRDQISLRQIKEIHIKHIGKFKPTTFLKAYLDGRVLKKS